MTKSLFIRSAPVLLLAATLLLSGYAVAVPITGQGTWETTLKPRDLSGNPVAFDHPAAVFLYDTDLDITWNRYWTGYPSRTWDDVVNNFVRLTNINGNLGGFTDWRLPRTTDINNDGCSPPAPGPHYAGGTDCGFNVDPGTSEMAHLWYITLGNLSYCPAGDPDCDPAPQAGWGLTNTATFLDMRTDSFYWSETENETGSAAWFFSLNAGFQYLQGKTSAAYPTLVRNGDVCSGGPTRCLSVVSMPEPNSITLLGIALAGIAFVRRRRST